MAYIGKKPEDKFRGLASYDTFTGDGSTTTFDVTNILPDGGTYDVEVFVDNVRQEGGAGKSYTIGNDDAGDLKRITFAVAPDNAAEIYVINPGRNTAVVTVTDNSLTAAKLQTDAVTTAKIQDDAVTSAKIADGTIVSSNIAPGTIANDRLANNSITINGNAVSLGGSITAGTDWQAVTVADGSTTLNAVAGKGYFLDTNTGVIEVFLPTSPTRGDTVILADYSGTFGTNKAIVNTGGALIDSTQGGPTPGNEFEITTNNAIVELVYVDAAKGWLVKDNTAPSALSTITGQGGSYDGTEYITATGGTISTVDTNFKVHTFTGDGCFVVSAGFGSLAVVDYMVVAGGGGGGASNGGGGGGGAGGFRESSGASSGCYSASPLGSGVAALPVSITTYPVTVGSGGAGSPGTQGVSGRADGSNSVFSTITSAGGGAAGGNPYGAPVELNGNTGGSGGGGAHPNGTGGSGNTPPVSPPQGNNGGIGNTNTGAGGGGATAVGQDATCSAPVAGVGGAGATTSISGSPTAYAGGGGGNSESGTGGAGGTGGGGAGASGQTSPGTNGTANTGGGGGGVDSYPGGYDAGSGGKGIVIIRYKFQN